jgi:hypothetical protein
LQNSPDVQLSKEKDIMLLVYHHISYGFNEHEGMETDVEDEEDMDW